jgi:hypothetical protein
VLHYTLKKGLKRQDARGRGEAARRAAAKHAEVGDGPSKRARAVSERRERGEEN